MASIKNFKKDLHYLTNELASECLFTLFIHPETNEDVINQIAFDGVKLRDEIIKRIANRDGRKNPKLVKEGFKQLGKDMVEGFDNLFDKLAKAK